MTATQSSPAALRIPAVASVTAMATITTTEPEMAFRAVGFLSNSTLILAVKRI